MIRFRLSEDTKRSIAADFAAGERTETIAAKHGIARVTVLRVAEAAGVDVSRGWGRLRAHRVEIRTARQRGETLDAIAARYGVSRTAIFRVAGGKDFAKPFAELMRAFARFDDALASTARPDDHSAEILAEICDLRDEIAERLDRLGETDGRR
jgi:transcriptional regulator with XRE-family HTH domain